MHGGQAGVRAEVGHLVLQGLGGGRPARGVGFQRVDLGPERRDQAARLGVGRLEVLHAPYQCLVSGHLVGGCQKLRLDLPGDQKPHEQGDGCHGSDAEQLPAIHR